MSYILDALKKAERQRRLVKIPTLETVHRISSAPRRRLWPWIAAVVVLVNAAVLISLLHPLPMPFVKSSARSTATPAAPTTLPGQPAPAPPADQAPSVNPSERPAAVQAAPQPAPSSSHAPASRRSQPERTSATTAKSIEAKPGPPVALEPAAPGAERPKPKPADAPAPPTPPAAPEKPPASAPAPAVPPVAATPDKPAAPPVAPSPTSPTNPATRPPPAPQDQPQAVEELIQNLKLQALAYSDVPAERLVFINGRKYFEGQSIDGRVVVESITPEGAILSYEGKRFMLRQQ